MQAIVPYIIRYLSLLLLLLSSYMMQAQQTSGLPPSVQVRFLKDSLPVEENSFAFNNISISNKSNSTLHVQLTFSAPGFVEIITPQVISIEIRPGDNQVIPCRFTINSSLVPSEWYPILAEMHFRELNQVIRSAFFIKPKENATWKALLKQPSVSFIETDKEVTFDIYIANTGNNTDSYIITIPPGAQLDVPQKSYSLELVPGESRVITIRLMLNPKDILHLRKEELPVFIKSRSGEQKMLIQYITRVSDTYTGIASSWNRMPLTVELNLQNLWSRQPFGSINANGYLLFKDKSQLNVLLRSDNYYNGFSTNTRMLALEYTKGPWQITGGSILDFNNFLIDGMGACVRYRGLHNGQYEAMAVKSRTGDTRQFNFKTSQPLGKRFTLSSNIFVNQDIAAQQTSSLALNKLQWNIGKSTLLSVEAGGGVEKTARLKLDTSLFGPQAGYHFETSGRGYQLNSTVSWYHKNFPGFNKGFHYQLHEARLIVKQAFAGPYFELNERGYNSTQDSTINYLFNSNNREYGLRLGWQNQRFSLVVSGGILNQVQDSASAPEARMNKLSINANWQISESWQLSMLSTIGRVKVTGPLATQQPFNTYTNFINLQSDRYGMQLRFDKGPYYYYEIKQFMHAPAPYQRLQIAPFLELPWRRKNIFCRFQANYLHEEQSHTNYLLLYNNIQYSLPRAGMDIGIITQLNVTAKEKPMVNLTIRKKLQLPVYKDKQSRSFKLLLFLDSNHNNWPDSGEATVNNARILFNNDVVLSNEKGEMMVRNADDETFAADFSQVSSLAGWIPDKGYRQILKPANNQKVIFIPFVRSKTVTGKMVLAHDPNSSRTMPLDGIRITAVSSKGEVYNTLTGTDGSFFINLPAGNYTVSVNQAIFDKDFRVAEPSKTADLENNETLNLQFEIRQSKRQMNIRKE